MSQSNTPNTPFRNKLTRLPVHIKNELDRLVSQGWGSQSIKRMLEDKYRNDPLMLFVSRKTYQSYINWLRTAPTQTEINPVPAISQPSDEATIGIKQLLNSQYEALEVLIQAIQQKKTEGYDPKLDDQIAKFQRDQRNILKLILEHGDDLIEKEKDEKNEESKRYLVSFITGAVEGAYLSINGQERIDEFKSALYRQIEQQIKNHEELYNHA